MFQQLPTRSIIAQAVAVAGEPAPSLDRPDLTSPPAPSLDDIKTCIYATARRGDLELYQYYMKQWDYRLAPYPTEEEKLRIVRIETNWFWIDSSNYFWNAGLEAAAEGGNPDIINDLFERGATILLYGGIGAAKGGSLDIIKQFIELGLNELEEVAFTAAIHGHIDIVEYLLDNYGVDVDELFIQACASGNMELIKYLYERKTNDTGYNWAMQTAATSGNLDLIIWLEQLNPDKEDYASVERVAEDFEKHFQNQGPVNLDTPIGDVFSALFKVPDSAASFAGRWNGIMAEAARFNHINIIDYCLDKGANDFSNSICSASRGGFIETVKRFLELAGDMEHNWERYLNMALAGENIELAQFFISKILDTNNQSALINLIFNSKDIHFYISMDRRFLINLLHQLQFSEWNLLLFAAARSRDLPLAKLAISQGATDFHEALNQAAPNDDNMREYLLDKMM